MPFISSDAVIGDLSGMSILANFNPNSNHLKVHNSLLFNPKEGGGGSYVPAAQEIAYLFLQDHATVLKLLEFFKNDVGLRVKESF